MTAGELMQTASNVMKLFNDIPPGMDMASAWMEHVAGKEFAATARAGMELSAKEEGDDEFAAVFGLV